MTPLESLSDALRDRFEARNPRGGTTRAGLGIAAQMAAEAVKEVSLQGFVSVLDDPDAATDYSGIVNERQEYRRQVDVIDRIVTILAGLNWDGGTVAQVATVLIDAGHATTVDGRFVRIEP